MDLVGAVATITSGGAPRKRPRDSNYAAARGLCAIMDVIDTIPTISSGGAAAKLPRDLRTRLCRV